jgi:peptidoglycan/LPS O-acetylase OafA/YrhL
LNNNTQLKFNGLNHLRAFAIIFVFFFHYYILSDGEPSWLPDVASFGWTGVDLFFVLSGFLISNQIFNQINKSNTFSIKQFFIKRIFKIIPPYLLTLALYFCVPIFREKEHLSPIWKFLSFTQNINFNLKEYGTFSHAWSLCVEEHFYLLFPLVLLLLLITKAFKKSYWIIVIIFLMGFIVRTYCYTHFYLPKIDDNDGWINWYKYIYYPTYSRLDGLLAGVSIAAVYNFAPLFWKKITAYGNYTPLLGLAILAAAYFLCIDQMTFNASVFGFPLVAIGYGLIVVGALSPSSYLFKCESKITSLIATWSYSIYLTHKGIIHITHHYLSDYKINSNLMLVCSIITCTIFAYLLYQLIENPFLKLRNYFLH